MTPTRRTFLSWLGAAAAALGLSRVGSAATSSRRSAKVPPTDEESDPHIYLVSELPEEREITALRGLYGRTLYDGQGRDCLCVNLRGTRTSGGTWRAVLMIDPRNDGRLHYILPGSQQQFEGVRVYPRSGVFIEDLIEGGCWRFATAKAAKKFMEEV